jgi:hypothetical protein
MRHPLPATLSGRSVANGQVSDSFHVLPRYFVYGEEARPPRTHPLSALSLRDLTPAYLIICLRHHVRTYNTLHKRCSVVAAPPGFLEREPWRRFLY